MSFLSAFTYTWFYFLLLRSIQIRLGCHAAVFVLRCYVVAGGGVDVHMAEDVGYQADVTALVVKRGPEVAAQLMGRDVLVGNGFPCEFVDDLADGLHVHPLFLIR